MYALYIGVTATAVSYLYLIVLPFYAQQVNEGAEANEVLWWYAIRTASSSIKTPSKNKQRIRLLCYALLFGIALSFSVLYKPWLPQASLWLNISLMALWLGGLWVLARIDQLCFLLPDVITQLLLWVGLLMADSVAETVLAVILVYVSGRVMNGLGFFWLAQPLFGQGDVKLVVTLTAWLGLQAVIPLLFWACVACMVFEAIRQRRWYPCGACAFGPYLVLAAVGAWIW